MTRKLRYIAVVGSRCATREDVLNAITSASLSPQHHAIVSGGCPKGADKWAKVLAEEMGFQYVECPPFWDRDKKGAGFARNSTIVDVSDALIAVWDASSKGTKDTIDKANATGKKVVVYAAVHGMASADE